MFAYLGQGKLHVCEGSGGRPPRTIDSAFGKSLRDRAVQIEQRHAWKTQGRGAQFMGGGMMFGGAPGREASEFPIVMTGLSSGAAPGELLYSLETNEVAGLFAVDAGGVERRIFHTADFGLRFPALSPDGQVIAASMIYRNGTANLGLIGMDGQSFEEVTEGDSIDLAPRWVPGRDRTVVFHTAGLGRDAGGRFTGMSPSAIEEIDFATGAMSTLAADPGFDFLLPQKDAAGNLYYIRRPYQAAVGVNASPLAALKDAALFPFRMANAMFQYFNFFSMRYSGKPLTTANGGAARHPDLERMMLLNNLLQATTPQAGTQPGTEESLVPAAWQLMMRRAGSGGPDETLAKGVLSFDLSQTETGVPATPTVLYSTGTAIHRVRDGISERLASGQMIGQVVSLSCD